MQIDEFEFLMEQNRNIEDKSIVNRIISIYITYNMTIFSKFQVCYKRCWAMHECDVSHIEITLSDFFVFAISSSSHMQKPYPRDTNLHNLILPKFSMSSYPRLTLNQFQPFAIKSLIKCTIPNMWSILNRDPIALLAYVT